MNDGYHSRRATMCDFSKSAAFIPAVVLLSSLGLPGCASAPQSLQSMAAAVLPAAEQSFDPATIPGGRYRLDPDHNAVLFEVNHLGFSNYVGRFEKVAGWLDFDPETPDVSSVSISIDAASLNVANPAFGQTLRGKQFFDADAFPDITFLAQRLVRTDARRGTLSGVLTLKGRALPLDMAIVFNGGARNPVSGAFTLGFHGEAVVKRSLWGMDAYTPMVGDDVTVTIRAEFIADDASV